MSSFAQLRAQQGNALENIKKKINAGRGGKDPTLDDERYWHPSHVRGKDGVGEAVLRFLPAPPGENDEFVKYEEFITNGPGGWYINRSRKALGPDERDPAFEYNGEIFKKYKEKEERKKHLLQRNVHVTVGIYVVSDPNAPENEGKVFRWKVGPQIWNVVQGAMFPEFKSQKPINPFNPVDPDPENPNDLPGANFTLRVYTKKIPDRNKGGLVEVPSYEKSSFDATSALCSIDEFEKIWKKQYGLAEIIAPDQFKSYETLVQEFNRAMGLTASGKKDFMEGDDVKPDTSTKSRSQDVDDEIPDFESTSNNDDDDDDDAPFDTGTSDDKVATDDNDDWFNSLKG